MKMFLRSWKQAAAGLVIITFLLLPALSLAEEIIDDDCNINEAVFERDWRKYSDFPLPGEDISAGSFQPLQSRSFEMQQHISIQKEIDDLNRKSFMLQAEMEFDRHIRLELREVKQNLVNNLRANLVKSLIRLSFLTADALKTGTNLGRTYSKLFTTSPLETLPEGLSYLKDNMEVVTGLTPKQGDSELAKEVKSKAGDLEDVLKIAANPKEIANVAATRVKGKAEEKLGQLFPDVKDLRLSDEELAILRNQNLMNRALDDILMESYRINSERRNQVMEEIPAEIRRLQEGQAQWELEEKERVRNMLISNCEQGKERKKEQNGSGETGKDKPAEKESNKNDSGETVKDAPKPAEDQGSQAGIDLSGIWQVVGEDEEGNWRLPDIVIYKDDAGQFMFILVRGRPHVVLNVEDRKVNFYYKDSLYAGDNKGEETIYWKMTGEIDKQGKVITGTYEITRTYEKGDVDLTKFSVIWEKY